VCLDGFYLDLETNQCKECLENCELCSQGNTCNLCESGHALIVDLDPEVCDPIVCLDGFYLDLETNQCKECLENCELCSQGNSCDHC